MINRQDCLDMLKNMFSPLDNFEEKLYVPLRMLVLIPSIITILPFFKFYFLDYFFKYSSLITGGLHSDDVWEGTLILISYKSLSHM